MNVTNTSTTRDSLLEMFLDATAGESYYQGRLVTRQEGENTVSLIAYGWNKIAEYNTETNTVTVFAGHIDNISETVNGYVRDVASLAEARDGRNVTRVMDASPNVARPPAESAQFINNYKSFSGSDSSVESWAADTVDSAVSAAAENLF